MEQTISTIAGIAGALSLGIAAIHTLIQQLIGVARDRKARKLEITIGDQYFIVDMDHLESVPFEQIEAAVRDQVERAQRQKEHAFEDAA